MKWIVLSCLLAIVTAETGESDETPVVLCGRQLARARVLLCYGSESLNKRNSPSLWGRPEPESLNELWNGRGWSPIDRLALHPLWERRKRAGLVDECCLNACTTAVIMSYC